MSRPRLDRPVYRLTRRDGRRGPIFIVRWTENGERHSVSTGAADEPAARRWLEQWAAGRETPPPPTQPTIGAILDGYLADRKGHVRAWSRLDFAAKAIRRHVGELEPDMLGKRMYWERRAREKIGKRHIGDGTILREGKTLRAALHWAVRQRWIAAAPYVELPERPPPRERWLSREEAARLIAACKAPHVRLFVLLAIHTAARKGALQELRWSQVDLDKKLIHLGRGHGNKRRATVPINRVLLAELRAAQRVAMTDHVLEFRRKPAGSVRKAFERAVATAKLPGVSPHVLRHSAATWMVEDGVPLAQVARFLGDSEAVVERVYGKHSPDYLAAAAASLERGFSRFSVHEPRKRPVDKRAK